jgi:hypothetical protein
MRIAKVGFFFFAFPVMGFFHWSITPTKEAIKPLSTPKTDTYIVVLLSFWAYLCGFKRRIFWAKDMG